MRRRLILAAATGLVVTAPSPALADHWPVGGGDPSRSSRASGVDQTPITPTWSAPDGAVRTPMVVTGGGKGNQRVAYGTRDGYVHLRMLESGAPVGPGEGVDIDDGSTTNDNLFGSGLGSIGFADTSTESRHGVLYIPHNDVPVATAAVFLARQRVDNGEMLEEVAITRSVQCGIDSSPLLTPAAPSGGRVLYLVMTCPLYDYLVRIPIEGDAASPGATLGTIGYANLGRVTTTASPSLAVLREEGGQLRYYVVVARRGGLSLFFADDALEATPGNTLTPTAMTAELADATESPQTPVIPPAAGGAVAGADGSGTGPSPALYVAAGDEARTYTRVYRFTQEGNARTLKRVAMTEPLPASGAPAPGMALSQVMTPDGLSAGGHLLVGSATNLTLLRADDLSIAAQASGTPLPAGLGFSRNVPLVSGQYAFVVRDGDADSPAEHLVLRLDGLTPLQPPAFAPQPDPVVGTASGQPAASSGNVVFGTARGPFAYASANARTTPRETITELPPKACSNKLAGTARRDRISGSRGGDRILGGAGGDRLSGGDGPDCVFGQGGNDVLKGGSGDDLLEGGSGADRIDAGAGRDRIVARDRSADKVVCGKGRDVAVVDRRDRVSRSCERVKKRR